MRMVLCGVLVFMCMWVYRFGVRWLLVLFSVVCMWMVFECIFRWLLMDWIMFLCVQLFLLVSLMQIGVFVFCVVLVEQCRQFCLFVLNVMYIGEIDISVVSIGVVLLVEMMLLMVIFVCDMWFVIGVMMCVYFRFSLVVFSVVVVFCRLVCVLCVVFFFFLNLWCVMVLLVISFCVWFSFDVVQVMCDLVVVSVVCVWVILVVQGCGLMVNSVLFFLMMLLFLKWMVVMVLFISGWILMC